MKTRPILMNAFSVCAILDGRKTQTRRVIHPQPQRGFLGDWSFFKSVRSLFATETWMSEETMRKWLARKYSPYGQPGDHLWVRETWATPGNYDDIKPSKLSSTCFTHAEFAYRATEPHGDAYYKWRPSIFMPRWASRIMLEVTGVRVERVQDITPEDVAAEGLHPDELGSYKIGAKHYHIPGYAFAALWNSINEKRGYGWDNNPWCWIVEFARIDDPTV